MNSLENIAGAITDAVGEPPYRAKVLDLLTRTVEQHERAYCARHHDKMSRWRGAHRKTDLEAQRRMMARIAALQRARTAKTKG